MTLLELCEPLFQYVCQVHRAARGGNELSPSQVRSEIMTILSQMRAKAMEQPGLLPLFEVKHEPDGKKGMELALVFFADFMIRESPLSWARSWEDIAATEYEEYAGDDKFFDLLEETLASPASPKVKEQIAVFYTCMGLGFIGHGRYRDEPALLKSKMRDCRAKMQAPESTPRICPEAYDCTDTRELHLPPAESLMKIGVVLAVVAVVMIAGASLLYYQSQRDLTRNLEAIQTASLQDGVR